MKEEYRLDDVLDELDSDDLLSRMAQDPELTSSVLRYCSTFSADTLAQRICEMDSSAHRMQYLRRLMALYPLSARVVEKILLDPSNYELCEEDDILGWMNVGEILTDAINNVTTHLIQGSGSAVRKGEQEYAAFVQDYESTTAHLQKQKDELLAHQADRQSKRAEMDKLQREIAELREWSPEVMLQRENALKSEKRKLEDARKVGEKRLKELERDMKTSAGADAAFDKMLEQLDELINAMPKDGTEQ